MNRSIKMGTLLLLVFGSLATIALAVQYNWNDLQRAHQMKDRGEFREARVLYKAIFRYGGDDGLRREACYFRGFCSVKMGDLWQALEDFIAFLNKFDRLNNTRYVPDALYALGRTYETIGEKPSQAKNYYRQCIRRFPGNEFARKAQKQLEYMEFDMSIPCSTQAADTYNPPAGSSSADPYESLTVDRLQINRVNTFIKAIKTEKDVDKTVTTLSNGDRELDTVKGYLKVFTQKGVFKQVHQDDR